MKPLLVLPFFDAGYPQGLASGAWPASSGPPIPCIRPAAGEVDFVPPSRAVTTTPPFSPILRFAGPGEESENQEEDQDDLELETDEDHNKLRVASPRPGAEEGNPGAARGGDGTINPPFP